ncbi:heavy-metal-associated domain-containing protein [Streptomyces sp. NBC_00286]|uniref:heavy-metal-associated domain-containing protein n=1 Tax=Streptomyces sp. NBC_00286 TaxID=2975701 RepID=UPI002E2AD435|nr:heavy-metal-associated domain-containing protein [Streptomyces sp. NBC_00286]
MSCSHCESAVKEGVSALDSVVEVQVDIPTGRVTVTSATPLDDTRMARPPARRVTNSQGELTISPSRRKPDRAAVYYGLAYSVAKGSQGDATARGSRGRDHGSSLDVEPSGDGAGGRR